jgi:hypothetical protein
VFGLRSASRSCCWCRASAIGWRPEKEGSAPRWRDCRDETITRANLQVITKQLDELGVRQARLRTERDGTELQIAPSDQ